MEYFQLGNIREWTLNGYIDEQFRTGPWLFDLGARLDYLNFFYQDRVNTMQPATGKAIVSPKFNTEYTFNDRAQVYLKLGKGFHSNDAKVVAQDRGIGILPAAYGADLGMNWKPVPRLYVNAAVWYLFLQQELTYNGDEGIFEPGDRTKREGIDLSARYELTRLAICRCRCDLLPRAGCGGAEREQLSSPVGAVLWNDGSVCEGAQWIQRRMECPLYAESARQ